MSRRILTLKGTVALLCATLLWPGPAAGQADAPHSGKYVEVDKARQRLRAFDAGHLFLECRVSTGRYDRSTPNGLFQVQSKSRMHYSTLYHHAPMPWSVHIVGNVFIHGYSQVPDYPASHGCIRMPLCGDNPAKRFYDWVEIGVPVTIIGHWKPPPRAGPAKR